MRKLLSLVVAVLFSLTVAGVSLAEEAAPAPAGPGAKVSATAAETKPMKKKVSHKVKAKKMHKKANPEEAAPEVK